MPRTETTSQSNIRRLLDIALRGPTHATELCAADIDLLIVLLRRVQLHAKFAADLQREEVFHSLPQVAQDQLGSALVLAESRNRVASWELDRIEWATRDQEDLQPICMKGCAYILLGLPFTKGRIFADVDLLLPEKRLVDVEQLLNRRGWKTKGLSPYDDNYYRRWTHELPPLTHRERDIEIDLHHNIVPQTARLKPSSPSLVANAQAVSGSHYLVLANEDLVLHAMVHLMFDSALNEKLRDLVDINEMCRFFAGEDQMFWNRLIGRADELGLGRPLYYSLRYCTRLLNASVPSEVIDEVRRWEPPVPIRWLMDRLVPRAMLPEHPMRSSLITVLARLLLYMRSHWLRMPPWLLAYHLAYKFLATRVRRTQTASGQD